MLCTISEHDHHTVVAKGKLRATFKADQTISIAFGSDCSGADAPYAAWVSVKRVIEEIGILKELRLDHLFASEAPSNVAAQQFLLLNTPAAVLFSDMVTRDPAVGGKALWSRQDDGDVVRGGEGKMPRLGQLSAYHSSFCCQDLSTRNVNRPGMSFDISPDAGSVAAAAADQEGQSTMTFLASIRTRSESSSSSSDRAQPPGTSHVACTRVLPNAQCQVS